MTHDQTVQAKDNIDADGEGQNGVVKTPKAPKHPKKSKVKSKAAAARRRGRKPYPVIPFEQALRIGQGIADYGAGHPMKRVTLLEKLGLPLNQTTKDLITASSKYGITTGGHAAPEFGLTEEGMKAAAPAPSAEQSKARIKLAITDVEPFKKIYEKFSGGKMPAVEAMRDSLDDLDEGDRAPCVDIFVQNAKFVGVLQTREGAEFITSLDEALSKTAPLSSASIPASGPVVNQPVAGEDFESVCFFIAPIGADDSEHRRHSDAILSSYVERALATVEPKLRVVRADKITQPGMITKQVIEYLLKSRLVVADLSYHNPNVFYELAVRHATGKPVIHIKRTSDPIPFDNKDFRTIDIAFDDKFDILSQIETVRSTIAQFSRQSLGAGDNSDNPLLIYFPDHRFAKVAKLAGGSSA
jgi:hypothetical protein